VESSTDKESCKTDVSSTEGGVAHTVVGTSVNNAEFGESLTDISSFDSICTSGWHLGNSATGLQQITEAASENIVRQLDSLCTSPAGGSVQKKPHRDAVTLMRSCYGDVQKEKDCTVNISEHQLTVVCEDDLSVFFASPGCVSSLSTAVRAVPKRNAACTSKHQVTSDCSARCDHARAYCDDTLNITSCAVFPHQQQPLHDVLDQWLLHGMPDQQPLHDTPDLQPLHHAPDQQPLHCTPNQEPLHHAPDHQPLLSTPDQQPLHGTPNQEPLHHAPDHQPLHGMPDQQPLHHAPDLQPLHGAPDQQPLHATPDQQPLHGTPNQEPLHHAPDQQPLHGAPDQQPLHDTPDQQLLHSVPHQLLLHDVLDQRQLHDALNQRSLQDALGHQPMYDTPDQRLLHNTFDQQPLQMLDLQPLHNTSDHQLLHDAPVHQPLHMREQPGDYACVSSSDEQSIVDSCSVGQSSTALMTDTGQRCMSFSRNDDECCHACLMLPSTAAVLSPSTISHPPQHQSSCSPLADPLPGCSVSSQPPAALMKCSTENQLQKLVKYSSNNFLYPSAYHSPVSDVPKCTSNDGRLLPAKRLRSVLYRTPDVLQLANKDHMNKAAPSLTVDSKCSSLVQEVTFKYGDVDTVSVLTLPSDNSLLPESNIESCDLNRTAQTSASHAECGIDSINAVAAYDNCSVPERAGMETYCDTAVKMSLQAASTGSTAPLLSKPVCDFSGQTSPGIHHRMMLHDIGVQTDLDTDRVASENTGKEALLVNVAVQTVPQCICSKFIQLYNNRHSQKSNSLRMNNMLHICNLHETSCRTDVTDMNSKFFFDDTDSLPLLNTDNCEEVSSCHRCTIEDAYTSPEREIVTVNSQIVTSQNSFMSANVDSEQCMVATSPAAVSKQPSVRCNSAAETDEHVDKRLVCDSIVSNNSHVTSVSSAQCLSTGFMSAGGKPLNIKLSSKLNACRLMNDVAEGDDFSSAVALSNIGFSASSRYKAKKLGPCLARDDIGLSSELMDAGSELVDCCFNDGSVSLNGRDGWSPVRNTAAAMSSVTNSSSSHELSAVSSSMHCLPARQFIDNECTTKTHADTATDYSAFMLQKSHSKDTSNGFKPFKAPRSAVQSSKHTRNRLADEVVDKRPSDVGVAGVSAVQHCSDTELLSDLTNTQRAEVVDASLVMLQSAELFAVTSHDDVCEQPLSQHQNNNNSVSNCCEPVCMKPSTHADRTCENSLTVQLQHADDSETGSLDVNRMHTAVSLPADSDSSGMEVEKLVSVGVENNAASCYLTAGGSAVSECEDTLRDTVVCSNTTTVFVDVMPACVGDVSAERVDSCQHCSRATDGELCRCVNKASQSVKHITAYTVNKDETDADISPHVTETCCVQSNKAMECDKDTSSTHATNRFLFFTAKGSKVNVSEKTLRCVQQNWNHHVAAESMKVAGVTHNTTLQTNREDVNARSIDVNSETLVSLSEHCAIADVDCVRGTIVSEADENTLLSSCATDVHSVDVDSKSVMNVTSVDNTAVGSYTSCLYDSVESRRLPVTATNLCSYAAAGAAECHTDRRVIMPLHTVPESK